MGSDKKPVLRTGEESRQRKIESYVVKLMGGEDRILREIRKQSVNHRLKHGAGCSVYPSSPIKAKVLQLILKAIRARRVLEVGSGLGYSAVWLARALGRTGSVETVESDPIHVKLARANLEKARVASKVRVLQGRAEYVLPQLKQPYDLVFEDAAHGAPPQYLKDLSRLTRVGGFLVTSNWFTIEQAIVGEPGPWSSEVSKGTKAYAEELFSNRRFVNTLIPHVWWGISMKVSR